MTADIITSLIWCALFYAGFPWLLAVASRARATHLEGADGFRRDVYLRLAPIMPFAGTFQYSLGRALQGQAGISDWGATSLAAIVGLALLRLPVFSDASTRLKAAGLAAGTMRGRAD